MPGQRWPVPPWQDKHIRTLRVVRKPASESARTGSQLMSAKWKSAELKGSPTRRRALKEPEWPGISWPALQSATAKSVSWLPEAPHVKLAVRQPARLSATCRNLAQSAPEDRNGEPAASAVACLPIAANAVPLIAPHIRLLLRLRQAPGGAVEPSSEKRPGNVRSISSGGPPPPEMICRRRAALARPISKPGISTVVSGGVTYLPQLIPS